MSQTEEQPVESPGHRARVADMRNLAQATLKQIGRLDIRPGSLMAVLDAPPDDPDKVTKALLQSSVLSARVLSVTNSAAIGVVGEINDIRRAVIHMGAARARSIAMAFGLHMLAEESGLDRDLAHQLWVNSLEKAHLARLVAQAIDPQQVDRAYTLGLIQDVGLSALWVIAPDFYSKLDGDTPARVPLSLLEQERFGIDHAAVGAHLLKSWDASPILCEEVLNHHLYTRIRSDATPTNMGNLIAGILPHVGEAMTPDRSEWVAAVHCLFLSSAYDSPEAMIRAASRAAHEVHGGAPSIRMDPATRLKLLSEVHTDTAYMVRQLCEMENLLSQKFQQVNELQFEAVTDPLTQVLNRRGFDRLSERRMQTAIDRGLPVCAVVLDLDGFKRVNDTFGHDAGDKMLTEFAEQVRKNIASGDLFGRLGGDEFAIFLVNVNNEDAQRIVQRIARACHGKPVDFGNGRQAQLCFSVGAVTCPKPDAQTRVADLLTAADDAMYASKRSGPGGVTVSEYPGHKKAS
ncbi:MAG: diguanylate cyclase [Phycisphaerales bacterium]